jgi:cysteine desulfurase
VLKAMGFSHDEIAGSLRLTVGISNTESEITRTVEILKKVVDELRAISPLKEKYGF